MGAELSTEDTEIYLFRSEVTVTIGTGDDAIIGMRGYLVINNIPYHTLERGGNYVRLNVGESYLAIMEKHSKKEAWNNNHLFRIMDLKGNYIMRWDSEKKKDTERGFLMHSCYEVAGLSGCVAPGTSQTATGINGSKTAMKQIIQHLGGFAPGRRFKLNVNRL